MVAKIAVASNGLWQLEGLPEFLQARICRLPYTGFAHGLSAVAGWGIKESGRKAEAKAHQWKVPVLHLEDGFLRSIYPGGAFRPYSMVVDEAGIYYDSTRPSDLENLLNSKRPLTDGLEMQLEEARQLIVSHGLSKYNHAPRMKTDTLRREDRQRVLVVDQTLGDHSVTYGGASDTTFTDMLNRSVVDNPDATIYVKTHPEVASGVKSGYLSQTKPTDQIVLLTEPVNPIDLLKNVDRVYTVTSTMGFEALLAGCDVYCFGLPWYAGWGVTVDTQTILRRNRRRSVEELFAAAYFHYTRYIHPETGRLGTIFDVIHWLRRERPPQ